jgi:hypothetical protein
MTEIFLRRATPPPAPAIVSVVFELDLLRRISWNKFKTVLLKSSIKGTTARDGFGFN